MSEKLQPKPAQEVFALYEQFSSAEKRSLLRSTPFALIAMGGVGIAIKIATGDEALAQTFSNNLIRGLYGLSLVASAPGGFEGMNWMETVGRKMALQIAEAEGKPIDPTDNSTVRKLTNRVLNVVHFADFHGPRGFSVYLDNLCFKVAQRVLMGQSEIESIERISQRLQKDEMDGYNTGIAALTFDTDATKEQIVLKGMQLSYYRWKKVAENSKQSVHIRRHANHMANKIRRQLESRVRG